MALCNLRRRLPFPSLWIIYCSCRQESKHLLFSLYAFFLLLSECTPLEHCCVHNMSPFVSSSGLSPGSREAIVQRAKVCLNCTEPNVARSSCWSLPVGQYLSDSRCNGSMVILARWTASNMAEELQTSISHQMRKRWTISGFSDFHIWHVASIRPDLALILYRRRRFINHLLTYLLTYLLIRYPQDLA